MFGKKHAIKKYAQKMPAELATRYGNQAKYSEAQVRRVIDDFGLSKKHISFAFVLFCTDEALGELGLEGEPFQKLQDFLVFKAPYMDSGGGNYVGDDGGFGGDGGSGGGNDG